MVPNFFRSPLLSNWQSIVARRVRRPDPLSADLRRPPLDFKEERVEAAGKAAFALDATREHERQLAAAQSWVEQAAAAALGFATAIISADPLKVIEAKASFMRFGDEDPFWLECITEFVEHYTLTRHSEVPYIKYRTMTDCILPPGTLPDRCRIAVISDWGTGDARAQALIEDVATHKPDIVIHLGDIYYACTAMEANAFLANLTRGLAPGTPRLFTLCGNHDMYSGAAPYYALLNRIGQPASYFCLRNAHWQFLAADTGYNDFNPFTKGDDATWIRDRDEGETYSELDWHRDKLANAGARRTVLMTHHPLFSRNDLISGHPVNGYLQQQFGDYLPDIALWLWGHEHDIVIYEPFVGLQKGRCIGAGGVPVSTLAPLEDEVEAESQDLPLLKPAALTLGTQATGHLYQLGYALVDLDGGSGRATYRQFDPSTRVGCVLYEEAL